MQILKMILIILQLLIIPELIGLLFTHFMKREKNNLLLAYVLGYLFEFGLCQIMTVPMIYARAKFTTLFYSYTTILVVLSTISIIINRKIFKNICVNKSLITTIKSLDKKTILIAAIAIILILLQTYVLFRYMHIDEDDAFYVATATTSVDTNSIFKYAAQTGREYGTDLPARYTLGPFPIFIAIISYFVNINPAIVAHTLLPAVFIPLVYSIYGLIADELFKKDKKSVFLFLIFMSIIHMWGNYTNRNNFTFLLFRIWQGKSVLANIILPATWLIFIKAYKNGFKLVDCLVLLITMFAGCLTTTMGIVMPMVTLIALSFIFAIKDKCFSLLLKGAICCIPCIVYGMTYLLI